jgi:hypothetical protein
MQIYNNVIYDTETATLLAQTMPHEIFKAGGQWELTEKSVKLYRTPNNQYFKHEVPKGPKGSNMGKLIPLTSEEAIAEYNHLRVRVVLEPDKAFPDIEFKEG